MSTIGHVVLRRLRMPLVRPYRLSYRTFQEFEPFLVEITDRDGRRGFADAHISPGSSAETREGAWAFCAARAKEVLGRSTAEAKELILSRFEESKGATTALVCGIEVLEDSPILAVSEDRRLPLLTPINATRAEEIGAEVEDWLAAGFATFKVKVGMDVDADLARVAVIQKAAAGRATLRLDANRAYDRAQAIRFAASLDPTGIALFEQPCAAEDWEANAAVAAVSRVPLMLDEPICTLADIARAATIPGVGFCKVKLKRFGSLARLAEGIAAIRAHGMVPVLGDGLGSEVHGWLEACVAQTAIDNAGEFNGFLKPRDRLLAPPLSFADGAVTLPAGYRPALDAEAVARFTVETLEFGAR